MRIGSLFSGIGLLELGLQRGIPGAHTVFQVEIDQFCRSILAKHWPNVRRYDDITTINGDELERVDLLCGGFPCQGNSSAGKRLGLKDPRSALWFDYLRVVEAVRPKYVIVENVTSGKKLWLPTVREDLGSLGYRTRAFDLSALDVGAPHLRRRVFVLAADPERVKLRDESRWSRGAEGQGTSESPDDGKARSSADTDRERESQPCRGKLQEWRWARDGSRWTIVPPVCGVDDGRPRRMDRSRRLKALGNGVVVQCGEVVGKMVYDLERLGQIRTGDDT